tara:strand:+ start:2731 stop:3093 length:363 start_codon:yes stop_codon:yes gene_type:complete
LRSGFQNEFNGETIGEKWFHFNDPLIDFCFIFRINVILGSKKNRIKTNQEDNQVIKMFGCNDPHNNVSEFALVVKETQRYFAKSFYLSVDAELSFILTLFNGFIDLVLLVLPPAWCIFLV